MAGKELLEGPQDGKESLVGQKAVGGRYDILELLGEGGMGAVYKAYDRQSGSLVAFKVIDEQLGKRPEMIARFRREAMALAMINHPNVVGVIEMRHLPKGIFLTMEYLKGNDLHTELRPNGPDAPAVPLSWERACPLLKQICDALAAAHGEGILHRDLKPRNIFLVKGEGEEVLKVLDFGLAKVKEAQNEDAFDAARLTRTDVFLGTPSYGSPEQAAGEKDYDGRADLYSLGVVAFELLTGTVPFKGQNYQSTLQMHIREPPPMPRGINPSIPEGVEDIILRLLAKSPDERFQTAKELKDALTRCEGHASQSNSSDEYMQGAFTDGSHDGTSRISEPISGEMEIGMGRRPAPSVRPGASLGRAAKWGLAFTIIGGLGLAGYEYRAQISRKADELSRQFSTAPSASAPRPAPSQSASAARSETGRRIDITVTPNDLSVFVAGGRFLGKTPIRNIRLESGEDELVIWNRGSRMVVHLGRDQTAVSGAFRATGGGAIRTRPINQSPAASDQAPVDEAPTEGEQQ